MALYLMASPKEKTPECHPGPAALRLGLVSGKKTGTIIVLKVALKVVERPAFHEEEVELWSADSDQGHSLHKLGAYPGTFPAELPAYFIARYTKRGEAVLDPFCGSGTTTLEAALAGRVPVGADINPVAVALSRPRS